MDNSNYLCVVLSSLYIKKRFENKGYKVIINEFHPNNDNSSRKSSEGIKCELFFKSLIQEF